MALPTSLAGFTVVPITYSSSCTHYLYVRSHQGSKKNSQNPLPEGRTLFMVNVPPDATERELSQLFKNAGTVEKVVFDRESTDLRQEDDNDDELMDDSQNIVEGDAEEQPRKRRKVVKDDTPKVIPLPSSSVRRLRQSGRTAHLIFLDSSSLERALSSATKPRPWPSSEEPSGLSYYLAQYDSLRPPLDAIREHADSSVQLYEHELQKTKQKSKYRKGEAIVDEDGFTLVTRGGAYGKTLGGGVGVASKQFQRSGQTLKRSRNNKKQTNKTNFYAFQKAEKQRNDLINLKKKFEEDKARVEAHKASRRFKPY